MLDLQSARLGRSQYDYATIATPLFAKSHRLLEPDGAVAREVSIAGEQRNQRGVLVRNEPDNDTLDLWPPANVPIEGYYLNGSAGIPSLQLVGTQAHVFPGPKGQTRERGRVAVHECLLEDMPRQRLVGSAKSRAE